MRLKNDVEIPDRWRVLDASGFIGAIHCVGPDEWRNYHVAKGKPLSPVPRGPFLSLEAAFEAFTTALA